MGELKYLHLSDALSERSRLREEHVNVGHYQYYGNCPWCEDEDEREEQMVGGFEVTILCPKCGEPIIFARNGEMGSYIEGGEMFTYWGWNRITGCVHIRVDSGLMTTDDVYSLENNPRTWSD